MLPDDDGLDVRDGQHVDVLDVYLYGTRLAEVRRGRELHRLDWRWTEAAVRRWGTGSRVAGHGLPIGAAGSRLSDLRAGVVAAGLLPEGDARLHYAVNAAIDPDDTFALLRRYGRDTAGAFDFVPRTTSGVGQGTGPDESLLSTLPLTSGDVRVLLEKAGSSSREGGLTSISLAGMVPKIALGRDADGTWLLPPPGVPSTWILKTAHPPESLAADVVDTEAACLDLGRQIGVTTVQAEVLDLDGLRAIAVSRYDRVVVQGVPGSGEAKVVRIHQEDLAQALGINTTDPSRKFQRGRRIPSWRAAAEVLRAGGGLLSPLARLVAFSFLVGNSDHHAKNTSFLRFHDDRVELAPAYDVSAHLHHPGVHRTALDVAGESDFAVLRIGHVVEEVAGWGLAREAATAAVADVVTQLREALRGIDRDAHTGVTREAWALLEVRVAQAATDLGV